MTLPKNLKSWWSYLRPLTLLFFLVSFATGSDSPCSANRTNSDKRDSDVDKLLELTTSHKAADEFVEPLKHLAKKRAWETELEKSKTRLPRSEWDDARAATIRVGQIEFVVVLLRSWNFAIPGIEVQTIFLLNDQGKFLDRISCQINSRCRPLYTAIPTKPEPDGAQLIIRLDGFSARGNFAHYLYHGNEEQKFYWGHDKMPRNQPSLWDARGLCRIVIKDSKFQVILPTKKDKSVE